MLRRDNLSQVLTENIDGCDLQFIYLQSYLMTNRMLATPLAQV